MRMLHRTLSKWLSADRLLEWTTKWANKYGYDDIVHNGMTRRQIIEWIREHGPVVDPDEARHVLDHLAHWPVCDSCNQAVDFTATVGRVPERESATADLCITCLRNALAEAEVEYARHQRREFAASEVFE